MIEGHAGATLADPLVFKLEIDAVSGDVTLTQYRAVVHGTATLGDTSEAATLANFAAGIVVAKIGTATATAKELMELVS